MQPVGEMIFGRKFFPIKRRHKSEVQKHFPSHRRDKIETILQDTLFQPRPLLEDTVQKTLAEVLVIREDILTRTKSIRSEDGEVTICPEQGIKQEEKLTEIRMSGRTHGGHSQI